MVDCYWSAALDVESSKKLMGPFKGILIAEKQLISNPSRCSVLLDFIIIHEGD